MLKWEHQNYLNILKVENAPNFRNYGKILLVIAPKNNQNVFVFIICVQVVKSNI